jgi:hypothetical protein
MKTRNIIEIFACTMCCLLMSSCDVHEFPDPSLKEVDFTLHLDYSTEMPLYKVVEYNERTRSGSADDAYDVRYLVNVYDKDESARQALHSFIFSKDDVSELDNSVTFRIRVGEYRFVVWTDYVEQGSTSDMFYATDKFEYISFASEEYFGNEDRRDAFTGTETAVVSDENLEATVSMSRPMAKFRFVTNDLQDFIVRAVQAKGTSELDDYEIVFKYNGFVPTAYNLHAGGTTDSGAGYTFSSKISQISDTEAELGFDYVFVNEHETVVSVYIEVYDSEGKHLSTSVPVDVPLMRSKLTTVVGNFLTSDASGGVFVSPGYDGEHNIVVR